MPFWFLFSDKFSLRNRRGINEVPSNAGSTVGALLVDLAGFFDARRRFNEGICISDSAKTGGNRRTVREIGYLLADEGEILLLGSFFKGVFMVGFFGGSIGLLGRNRQIRQLPRA